MSNLRRRVTEERGFTFIELLVAILIIGILAAVAIPAFLNQTAKATDASAKELAHTAQVAAESYSTDHDGSYASLSAAALQQVEGSIHIAADGSDAYVLGASGDAHGYTITIAPATGAERFTITRVNGLITRTCTPASGTQGGCFNGSW